VKRVTIDKWVTSDGREWALEDQAKAQAHENEIFLTLYLERADFHPNTAAPIVRAILACPLIHLTILKEPLK